MSRVVYGRAMSTPTLEKLLHNSGLAEKAHQVEANLVRLQWGSAFVLVGVSGSAIVAIAPLFRTPPERVYVVPNGVEKFFTHAPHVPRGPWLVTTASVSPRKRALETGRAAVVAQTPYWFIGKPFAQSAGSAPANTTSRPCRRPARVDQNS